MNAACCGVGVIASAIGLMVTIAHQELGWSVLCLLAGVGCVFSVLVIDALFGLTLLVIDLAKNTRAIRLTIERNRRQME